MLWHFRLPGVDLIMLTAHKLRRLCRFYWLQRVQNVYRSGHDVLNHTQRFGSVVTFNSNVAGRDRYIRSVLHNDSGSQMVKCFHLATKRLCTHSANRRCWSCGSSAPSFFCPSCKLVQPPAERTSYFDILDWWDPAHPLLWNYWKPTWSSQALSYLFIFNEDSGRSIGWVSLL